MVIPMASKETTKWKQSHQAIAIWMTRKSFFTPNEFSSDTKLYQAHAQIERLLTPNRGSSTTALERGELQNSPHKHTPWKYQHPRSISIAPIDTPQQDKPKTDTKNQKFIDATSDGGIPFIPGGPNEPSSTHQTPNLEPRRKTQKRENHESAEITHRRHRRPPPFDRGAIHPPRGSPRAPQNRGGKWRWEHAQLAKESRAEGGSREERLPRSILERGAEGRRRGTKMMERATGTRKRDWDLAGL